MSKIELAELLQQDINELKEVFNCEKHDIAPNQVKLLAKGIINNLQDHLEELIKKS